MEDMMRTILDLLVIIGCIILFIPICFLGIILFPIIFYVHVYSYYTNKMKNKKQESLFDRNIGI